MTNRQSDRRPINLDTEKHESPKGKYQLTQSVQHQYLLTPTKKFRGLPLANEGSILAGGRIIL